MRVIQKNRLWFLSCFLLLGLLVLTTNCEPKASNEEEAEEEPAAPEITDCDHRYPDYDGPTPPGVPADDLYYLNQDWPEEPKSLPTEVTDRLHSYLPITQENISDLLLFLRGYVFEQLVPSDFSQRGVDWFAIPNMGRREAMHGMYDGNNINPGVWDSAQVDTAFNFTTDLYNDVSAYTIGRVWGDCERSINDPLITPETNQFPEGSIVVKLAMTSLPPAQAPFLDGAFSWQVYGRPNGKTMAPNPEMVDVRLIQMDVIIKDAQLAPETGWLFSTFVYSQDAEPVDMPPGTPDDKVGLYKMIPLGSMWGNDPGVVTRELKETVLNPYWTADMPQFISNTLGFNGRLSGPIDDVGNRGSCMQCHLSAEWNTTGVDDSASVIFGTLGFPNANWTAEQKVPWMQNFNGLQSYGNTEVSPEVTRYINELGIEIGPDWIGMDYDFVMVASALNAMRNKGKVTRDKIVVGKH